jgi:RNA polymerase-binding transcription factor DksA
MKVKPVKPPAPVRPIGALPPEAVARAMQKAPPTPVAPRPGRTPAVVNAAREISEGGAGVTEKDYKEFEQRLLAERQKILKEMGHLENTVLKVNQRDSAGDLSGYSFHMADVGTDAMEREKAFMFASQRRRAAQEIDEALRKVYREESSACARTCGGRSPARGSKPCRTRGSACRARSWRSGTGRGARESNVALLPLGLGAVVDAGPLDQAVGHAARWRTRSRSKCGSVRALHLHAELGRGVRPRAGLPFPYYVFSLAAVAAFSTSSSSSACAGVARQWHWR